jgi:hypothetical protein
MKYMKKLPLKKRVMKPPVIGVAMKGAAPYKALSVLAA